MIFITPGTSVLQLALLGTPPLERSGVIVIPVSVPQCSVPIGDEPQQDGLRTVPHVRGVKKFEFDPHPLRARCGGCRGTVPKQERGLRTQKGGDLLFGWQPDASVGICGKVNMMRGDVQQHHLARDRREQAVRAIVNYDHVAIAQPCNLAINVVYRIPGVIAAPHTRKVGKVLSKRKVPKP